jgi:hypothetical protein
MTYSIKSNHVMTQKKQDKKRYGFFNYSWISYDYASDIVAFRIDSSDYRNPTHFMQITRWGFRGKFLVHYGLKNKLLLPYREKIPEAVPLSTLDVLPFRMMTPHKKYCVI